MERLIPQKLFPDHKNKYSDENISNLKAVNAKIKNLQLCKELEASGYECVF